MPSAPRKSVILSFDDGPAPISALTKILTTLKKNSIRAEFYVLGSEVQRYRSGAVSIVSQKHKIHNHSWSHKNLATASKRDVQSELEKTQKIIKEVTGEIATKVRPPYGRGGWPPFDPELNQVARALKLTIQNWDIDTKDWASPKGIGQKKLDAIKKQFQQKGSQTVLNVLMHVQDPTARDLEGFIAKLKEWGFSFANP